MVIFHSYVKLPEAIEYGGFPPGSREAIPTMMASHEISQDHGPWVFSQPSNKKTATTHG